MVDERISYNSELSLTELGFEVIKLPPENRLSPAVASHTDMLFFRHKNTLLTSQKYFSEHVDLFEKITAIPEIEILLTDEVQQEEYPKDRIFNCLVIDNKIFAKKDYLSSEILKYAENFDLKLVSVAQGYPACVALGVPGTAITSDKGIARSLESEGLRVLTIPESEKIKLPPYKFGFIGGTAGVFRNIVYFAGNLYSHPYGKEIEVALNEAGYSCVSLDAEADSLFDVGGIFFFESPLKRTAKSGKTINPKSPNKL